IAIFLFFFSSRRRHTRFSRDWSSDVCSSDLAVQCASVRSAVSEDADHALGAPSLHTDESESLELDHVPFAVKYGLLHKPFDRCRSEERRVGKECRSRWWPFLQTKTESRHECI